MQRQRRTLFVRAAHRCGDILLAQNGQCPAEHVARLCRVFNRFDRQRKATTGRRGREHVRASNDEEGREAFCKAPRPAFDDDFRPDPRRIANRYGEGRHAQRQLYSMKASLRRSRR